MSDSDEIPNLTPIPAPTEAERYDGGHTSLQPLTQADLDDVLSNPGMTIDEKRAWLAAYAGQAAEGREADRGGEFEPLDMQIRDALSILADGGHLYGAAEPEGSEPAVESSTSSLDDNESMRR
jgi:hypothetical protein